MFIKDLFLFIFDLLTQFPDIFFTMKKKKKNNNNNKNY